MRLDKKIAILGVAGALMALPAFTPAWATGQQPQLISSGTTQPARILTLRAAAKMQTNLSKDRMRRAQLRAMRDAKTEDGAAGARSEPRTLSAGNDANR